MWVFTLLPHVRIESAFTLGRMATPTSCSASGLHPDRPMKGQGQDNGFLGTVAFPWAPRQVFHPPRALPYFLTSPLEITIPALPFSRFCKDQWQQKVKGFLLMQAFFSFTGVMTGAHKG